VVAGLTLARGGPAFVPVDGNVATARRDRRGGQGQIDPQAPPTMERALPVIPERVGPLARVADTAQVGKSPVQEGANATPFRLAGLHEPDVVLDGLDDVVHLAA
jgi:hypothetical protein